MSTWGGDGLACRADGGGVRRAASDGRLGDDVERLARLLEHGLAERRIRLDLAPGGHADRLGDGGRDLERDVDDLAGGPPGDLRERDVGAIIGDDRREAPHILRMDERDDAGGVELRLVGFPAAVRARRDGVDRDGGAQRCGDAEGEGALEPPDDTGCDAVPCCTPAHDGLRRAAPHLSRPGASR